MIALLTAISRDKRGTTTIEYGMICGMIVLAIIVAVQGLGNENGGMWSDFSTEATTAMADAG